MEHTLQFIESLTQILGFGISTITLVLGYIQYRANQKQKIFEDIYFSYVKTEINHIKKSVAIVNFTEYDKNSYPSLKKYWKEEK